jgi:hypothetical protein
MTENKGVSLAILGIVAVIAVVGLVLLFTGTSGKFVEPGLPKVYTRQSINSIAYGAGNPENPYGSYDYETWGSRSATGKKTAAGGAWDPSNVHGEIPFPAATEDGTNAAPPSPYGAGGAGASAGYGPVMSPTYKRSPDWIPTSGTASDVCGGCPNYETCIADSRRVPSGAQADPDHPGCYVA